MEKLQKSLLLARSRPACDLLNDFDDIADTTTYDIHVPKDVKEGHFAVIAVDKRFVVPLSYLRDPSFLRLLQQAEEEYGFDHDGALTVPCQPSELERILAAC
ncbi:auxin-induced protein X15-like [Diospyros lotus]|uniref:auxin-induced protein X15-like n=1 Tax=Diospyros lotus TaxID=55363 RepID=UPI00225582B7|nr:auxin-induced protein X15-like [Diospyros lotus]